MNYAISVSVHGNLLADRFRDAVLIHAVQAARVEDLVDLVCEYSRFPRVSIVE